MNWTAIAGYTEAAAEKMPHAWTGGPQTAAAAPPARGDGGWRAGRDLGARHALSLPARPLRARQPDRALSQDHQAEVEGADPRRQGRLFQAAACSRRHGPRSIPACIERVPLSKGGSVSSVDPATMTVKTDFEDYKAAVANIVPPQKAAAIAARAGVADRTGWCPVEPVGFELTLQPGIHVLGDAALMGGMPKAAHAAAEQGKVCAAAIVAKLAGRAAGGAAARQHLLQPCRSDATASSRPTYTGRRKGNCSPVPGAVNTSPLGPMPPCAPRRRLTTRRGSAPSRRRHSGEAGGLVACLSSLLPRSARCGAARDSIPQSLVRPAGRCRRAAAPSSPTARSGFACCATAARSPRSASRATWRRAWRGRAALHAGPAPAAPGRCAASQSRHDHAALLSAGRADARRQEFPRQDHPHGRSRSRTSWPISRP